MKKFNNENKVTKTSEVVESNDASLNFLYELNNVRLMRKGMLNIPHQEMAI